MGNYETCCKVILWGCYSLIILVVLDYSALSCTCSWSVLSSSSWQILGSCSLSSSSCSLSSSSCICSTVFVSSESHDLSNCFSSLDHAYFPSSETLSLKLAVPIFADHAPVDLVVDVAVEYLKKVDNAFIAN